MPEFLITGPDGRKYKVTGENQEGALNALKKSLGGAAAPAAGDQARSAAAASAPSPSDGRPTPADVAAPAAAARTGIMGFIDALGEHATRNFAAASDSSQSERPLNEQDVFLPAFGSLDAGIAMPSGSIASSKDFADWAERASDAGAGIFGAAGRGASDIALSGAADEAFAGVDTLAGAGDYGANLAEERAAHESDMENFPLSRLTGQLGAGVVLARLLGKLFPTPATNVGRIGVSTGIGGIGGAAHGFGSGEGGVENRLANALWEGGFGTAFGFGIPAVAAGSGYARQKLADWFANNPTARSVDASPESLRLFGKVADADGTLGEAGQANIAAAGPRAMAADAGPNARKILDTAIQHSGKGGRLASQRISERVAGESEDVTAALNRSLGAPEGVYTARKDIRTGTASARGSAYDDAYAQPIDYASPDGMAIEAMVKTRVPKSAIEAANNLMRVEGHQSKQIIAKISDDGSVTFETLPDVMQLDYITRGLNEVADAANATGKLGGTTATGRAYGNLSNEIRDKLKTLVPQYETALATAADPIRRSQAVLLGSKMLSSGMARDEVADQLAGMTVAERSAVSQGLRSHIDELMANVQRTVMDGDVPAREAILALKMLSSRASKEKLALLLGEGSEDLLKSLDQAAKAFDLRAAVAENSKTFARQATDRMVDDMTDPGAVSLMFQEGKGIKASQRLLQWATGARPIDKLLRKESLYADVADLLTRPAGSGVFDAASQITARDQASQLLIERLTSALGARNLYPLTTPLAEQLLDRPQE